MKNQVVIRDAVAGRWLRFENPCRIIETDRPEDVVAKLRLVESLVEEEGWHAAGFLGYEAAPAFDAALCVKAAAGFPLVWFGLYPRPETIQLGAIASTEEAPCPSPDCTAPGEAVAHEWVPSVSKAEYARVIDELKECIANGETYQVNYTFRLRRPFSGSPWSLFLDLARAQPSEYAAYVDTPEFAICSASPELFFLLAGNELTSRPMKGTAARGRTEAEDAAQAQWLFASEKDRAENAMIVDMMRNDVGRVAEFGSVRVSDLFKVERYPTLWQMTSTVSATTRATVCDVLAALFPCASITGAPKPRTMQIIARVETAPRRIYTGCIGMIAPGRRAQFNVAIRTVLVDKARGEAEYGVGGGIVWDSRCQGEYDECLLKAQILTQRRRQEKHLQ